MVQWQNARDDEIFYPVLMKANFFKLNETEKYVPGLPVLLLVERE